MKTYFCNSMFWLRQNWRTIKYWYFILCLVWCGGQEKEGHFLTSREYLIDFLFPNSLKYEPHGKELERKNHHLSAIWGYQEDSEALKEECEKMSDKTSGGDGLVELEQQCQGVRTCSHPNLELRLGSTPPGPNLPLSTLCGVSCPGEESLIWLENYIPGGANWRAGTSLLMSRTRAVGCIAQRTGKHPMFQLIEEQRESRRVVFSIGEELYS